MLQVIDNTLLMEYRRRRNAIINMVSVALRVLRGPVLARQHYAPHTLTTPPLRTFRAVLRIRAGDEKLSLPGP